MDSGKAHCWLVNAYVHASQEDPDKKTVWKTSKYKEFLEETLPDFLQTLPGKPGDTLIIGGDFNGPI